MKKKDIIHQVAESEDVPAEEVEAVVDELLQLVQNRMEKGEETQIYGFGKFGVRWWKGRTGRDPQTGEEIEIEGRWIPYWSPSPTMIEEAESPPDVSEKVGGEAAAAAEGKADAAEQEEEKVAPAGEEVSGTPQESDKEEEETAEEKHPAVSGDFEAEKAGKPGKVDKEEVTDALPDTGPESRDTSKSEAAPGSDQKMHREDAAAEKEEPAPESAPSPPTEKETPDKSGPFTETPDWPDIGDEISMKELRFISERLKEEPGETSAGLFFFDEEDEVEEGADSVEVKEAPSVSLMDEDQEREAPDEEPLEWAVTERRRGKFGWGVIITLSFALILFGAYLLLQERLPDLSAFIPNIQMDRETVTPDQSGSEAEGDGIEESGIDLTREQPPGILESSGQEAAASAVLLEPYNFVGAARRESFLNVYNEALNQFEGENYRTAEAMFNRMLQSDPPGDYIDNIHYWLGECKYAQEQFEAAIREFELVFAAPNNNKVEDALIMMARSHIQLNQFDQAQTILRKFYTQYPNSQYADLAMQWIQQYDL